MNAGLALIAVAAGFVVYKEVKDNPPASGQPDKANKQPFWNHWLDSGDQPQTGNGGPTTDQTGHDVANTIQSVSKFATSLLDYFGTQGDNKSSGGGTSTGGPTNTYSSGTDYA